MAGSEFIKAIDNGVLPQVAFYKPQGNPNEHPGNTDVLSGDMHLGISLLTSNPNGRVCW